MPDGMSGSLAYGVASATKILLEGVYDKLFQTPVGTEMREASASTKTALASALLLSGVVLDQRLADDSPAKRFAKELILDFPSEIAKRLVNGTTNSEREPRASDGSSQTLFARILAIENEVSRDEFIRWLTTLTQEQRQAAKNQFHKELAVDLERFANLSPANRDAMVAFLREPTVSESISRTGGSLDAVLKEGTVSLRRMSADLRRRRLQQ